MQGRGLEFAAGYLIDGQYLPRFDAEDIITGLSVHLESSGDLLCNRCIFSLSCSASQLRLSDKNTSLTSICDKCHLLIFSSALLVKSHFLESNGRGGGE
jgi:hypothetical protein